MGVQNVGDMSLGEWIAISTGWAKAHGSNKVSAPTEDEFDRAVMSARGAA